MRVTPAFLMPGALKLLATPSPADYPWTAIQFLGVICLVATLYVLNRITVLVGIPTRPRYIMLLIFALHPIKAQALFWSTATFVYALPLVVFLLGVWLYFARAQHDRETVVSSAAAFVLMAFGAFAIEQLIPMVLVVVLIRSILFPFRRAQLCTSLAFFVVIAAAYIFIVALGPGAARLQRFSSGHVVSFSRAFEVILNFADAYTIYPIRLLTARTAWRDFFTPTVAVALALAVIIASLAVAHLSSLKPDPNTRPSDKRIAALLGSGVLLCLAPMSPFFVTQYYMPERIFYIPLIGVSLIAGVVMDRLWIAFAGKCARVALVSLCSLVLGVFAGASLFAQSGFAAYWHLEKSLISTVERVLNGAPAGTHLAVLGVPRAFGPTPSLRSDYALHGISDWLFPGQQFSASVLDDFSSVLRSSASTPGTAELLHAEEATRVVIWNGHAFVSVNNLLVEHGHGLADRAAAVTNYDILPPDQTVAASLAIRRILYLNDLRVLAITLNIAKTPPPNQRRLIVHAIDNANIVQPFDEPVDADWGFISLENGYSRTVLIPRADELARVELWVNCSTGPAQNGTFSRLWTTPELPVQILYR